ncbi:Similar to RNPC3: RNA-binding region-containing protein 3 (Bos taurus) [Cotesia congregata]|uniref:Similar to RNPC3: RNA-binding region-containing protein 3 (Bos taurus) n=1 Tax=Cotesia congregata TaxID=51543 RepID=A0A8J2MSY4_COTCN|nr:Similar to RNPC3: RNA-binding region-containing protein 3 (Bos taurus) [Cotesia congregata]
MSLQQPCDTLRVLHLPPYLSDEKRNELFKKFGAECTKTIRKSDTYTTTFVKFPSTELATKAFLQLHQLEIKGQYLSVEFAKKSFVRDTDDNVLFKSEPLNVNEKDDNANTKNFQAFIDKLNTWTSNYNFSQPPPPNISYKYPLPTRNILLRISIQLLREPAFYTQVLHLMNKMNLPPPFEELEAEFPSLKEVYNMEKYKDIFGNINAENDDSLLTDNYYMMENDDDEDDEMEVKGDGNNDEDEEESEMESDNEETNKLQEFIPVKRKLPEGKRKIKIPKFVNPTVHPKPITTKQKIIRPEDVFERIPIEEIKKKTVIKTDSLLIDKIVNTDTNDQSHEPSESGFGIINPVIKTDDGNDEKTKEGEKSKEFITSEELASNRISANDQRLFSEFKNYHPGKPSCRLYIKNLAKEVNEDDLHYIYRKYIIPNLENSELEYNINLMRGGRMKGQAFVTFQNIEQAQLALNETNGYKLKSKYMVVQFSNATNKK